MSLGVSVRPSGPTRRGPLMSARRVLNAARLTRYTESTPSSIHRMSFTAAAGARVVPMGMHTSYRVAPANRAQRSAFNTSTLPGVCAWSFGVPKTTRPTVAAIPSARLEQRSFHAFVRTATSAPSGLLAARHAFGSTAVQLPQGPARRTYGTRRGFVTRAVGEASSGGGATKGARPKADYP